MRDKKEEKTLMTHKTAILIMCPNSHTRDTVMEVFTEAQLPIFDNPSLQSFEGEKVVVVENLENLADFLYLMDKDRLYIIMYIGLLDRHSQKNLASRCNVQLIPMVPQVWI